MDLDGGPQAGGAPAVPGGVLPPTGRPLAVRRDQRKLDRPTPVWKVAPEAAIEHRCRPVPCSTCR